METSREIVEVEDVTLQIEMIGNIEDEEPKLVNDERYIPIEIIGKKTIVEKSLENRKNGVPGTRSNREKEEQETEDQEEQEQEEERTGVPLDICSHGVSLDNVPLETSSKRTSLIVTHEDGTVEENEGEVTCLGLTPDLDRKSKIIIEEFYQETQTSPPLVETVTARLDPEVRS